MEDKRGQTVSGRIGGNWKQFKQLDTACIKTLMDTQTRTHTLKLIMSANDRLASAKVLNWHLLHGQEKGFYSGHHAHNWLS